MDPDPVPTTESDIAAMNTQPVTDGEIIEATTAHEIGESTTTTGDDEEPGIGTDFGQISMGEGMTIYTFSISLIIAVAFAMLT